MMSSVSWRATHSATGVKFGVWSLGFEGLLEAMEGLRVYGVELERANHPSPVLSRGKKNNGFNENNHKP